MKRNLWAAALVAGIVCSTGAQAEGSYVNVAAGQSQYSTHGISLDETAISAAFGQTLTNHWGYELGYVTFGEHKGGISIDGIGYAGKLRVQSLYAATVGTLPVSESFSVFAKIGIAANYVSASGARTSGGVTQSRSVSDTKAGLMGGIGMAYQFTKDITAMAEYRYFNKVSEADLNASALTAGLQYNF